MSDPWHIGPRMRYWRERRGIPRQTFAELVGRSRSWVEMAETGHRVPYNVLDLVSVARALRVDLAAFLCDPIPDLPDGEQQQLLATLRDAFMGDDPRAGLARLAHRLADMEPGHELMLVVLPGGQWKVVNRRDALKLGAVLGVSLATPALNPDQAGELVASLESRQITHAGVAALRAVVTAYRRLDDEIGSATLRPLVQHNVQIVKGLQTRSEDVGRTEHGRRRTAPARGMAVVRHRRLRRRQRPLPSGTPRRRARGQRRDGRPRARLDELPRQHDHPSARGNPHRRRRLAASGQDALSEAASIPGQDEGPRPRTRRRGARLRAGARTGGD